MVVALALAQSAQVFADDLDRPALNCQHPGDQAEQGALSASAWTLQEDAFAFGDLELGNRERWCRFRGVLKLDILQMNGERGGRIWHSGWGWPRFIVPKIPWLSPISVIGRVDGEQATEDIGTDHVVLAQPKLAAGEQKLVQVGSREDLHLKRIQIAGIGG